MLASFCIALKLERGRPLGARVYLVLAGKNVQMRRRRATHWKPTSNSASRRLADRRRRRPTAPMSDEQNE